MLGFVIKSRFRLNIDMSHSKSQSMREHGVKAKYNANMSALSPETLHHNQRSRSRYSQSNLTYQLRIKEMGLNGYSFED